ncbi:MAG: hypothetical protein ACFCU5_03255 [Pleurocapsa sp.]
MITNDQWGYELLAAVRGMQNSRRTGYTKSAPDCRVAAKIEYTPAEGWSMTSEAS